MLDKRPVEGIAFGYDPTFFAGIDPVNVAILEGASGEGKLFCIGVDQQGAANEGAFVKTAKIHSAAEIECLRMECSGPEYLLFKHASNEAAKLEPI